MFVKLARDLVALAAALYILVAGLAATAAALRALAIAIDGSETIFAMSILFVASACYLALWGRGEL